MKLSESNGTVVELKEARAHLRHVLTLDMYRADHREDGVARIDMALEYVDSAIKRLTGKEDEE